jgi:hypothetical protein
LAVNTTALIAVAGLVTTLLAPLLASRLAYSQAREAYFRDLRTRLYIDAAEHIEDAYRRIDALTDEWNTLSNSSPEDLVHPIQLTARIDLLANAELREAWAALYPAEVRLAFEWQENPDLNAANEPYLSEGNPAVVDFRRVLSAAREALRKAMKSP